MLGTLGIEGKAEVSPLAVVWGTDPIDVVAAPLLPLPLRFSNSYDISDAEFQPLLKFT